MRSLNKVAAGWSRPLFLQRIHDREAAKKKEREAEGEHLTLILNIASEVLKANQYRPACRRRSRPKPRKDIWSHIGDFIFGD